MSEGREAPFRGQSSYPSAAPEQRPTEDPFGPTTDLTEAGPEAPLDPFSGPVEEDSGLVDAQPAASSADEGTTAFAEVPRGIPLVTPDQIRDAHLAEVLGRSATGHQGAASQSSSPGPFSGQETGEDPFSAGYGDEISAARTAPQDVFNNSQDLSSGAGSRSASAEGPAAYPSAQASYPSASALPVRRAPGRGFASGWRRMMQTDLPTAPMRVVEKLSSTPFAGLRRNQENTEARKTLNFALRLAETMFHYGADAQDVEMAIAATCATYGVDNVDVDITNQSVTINYVSNSDIYGAELGKDSDSGIFSHTVVRVVRSWSDNYAGLTETHRLVRTITAGELSREKAERRLDEITSMPKPFPRWAVRVSSVLAAGLLTIGIGGPWRGALVACFSLVLAQYLGTRLAKARIPGFFSFAGSSGIVTLVAMAAWSFGLHISPPHVIAAGLIMLLPTLSLVSTIQDAINGFTVTAAGRAIGTGLSFLGLIVGIAIAVAMAAYFGSPKIEAERMVFDKPENGVMMICMLLASALIAITVQITPAHIVPALLSEVVGLLIYTGANSVNLGGRMIVMVSALAVGCTSAWLAQRYKIPQVVLAVPALTFLMPGLAIFRGMYIFTVDVDPLQGLVPLMTAGANIMSMAAAVVLSQYLVRPFVGGRRPRVPRQQWETPEAPGQG